MNPKEALSRIKESAIATIQKPSQRSVEKAEKVLTQGITEDDIKDRRFSILSDAYSESKYIMDYGGGSYVDRVIQADKTFNLGRQKSENATDEELAEELRQEAEFVIKLANTPNLFQLAFRRK